MRRQPTILKRTSAGFTLIELLVVLAIVAILAVVVIMVLNPAELLKQSRDSSRINDLATIKSALSYYLTDVVINPNLASSSLSYTSCYLSTPTTVGTTTTKCGVFSATFLAGVNSSASANTYRKVDSTGWVPVNLSGVSLGSPLGQLPIDPQQGTNPAVYYYSYAATSTNNSFKMEAFMESQKYGGTGTSNVVITDGGNNTATYEVGTNLTF